MPSRSEGWGGLFKDEQYRLIKRFASIIRSLRSFEQTTPPLRIPLLTKEGNVPLNSVWVTSPRRRFLDSVEIKRRDERKEQGNYPKPVCQRGSKAGRRVLRPGGRGLFSQLSARENC